jgi:molybdopterin-guanine dinucleotide biosynthesis protein A
MPRSLGFANAGIEGFVLAGGRSTRFGSNKALALVDGRPLLVHALHAVRTLGIEPRVVCSDPFPYRKWASAFVLSERPGLGPLEAVRAGLSGSTASWNLIVTADMPGVDPDLLRILLREGSTEPAPECIVCFEDGKGRRHPFPGVYPRSVLSSIESMGDGGSMHRLLDETKARVLGPEALPAGVHPTAPARNINRPEDL